MIASHLGEDDDVTKFSYFFLLKRAQRIKLGGQNGDFNVVLAEF
jgi:hypothetical protein